MGNPYLGEIRTFAGNFAPAGWALCQGQLLPISDYEALFNLIGTTYGGNGEDTFALPDLRGRVPIHMGNTYTLATTGGVEEVTLTNQTAPTHTHGLGVVGTANSADTAKLAGGYLANGPLLSFDNNPAATRTALAPTTISSTGGSQPHENMAPYLTLNFIIALYGIFPSPT